MQLIVLGMHRSGTSMLTRLINMMGAYVGPENKLIGFDERNLKGYWERADVFPVNDVILRSRECSWSNLADWDMSSAPPLSQQESRVIKTIVLRMDAFRPWVMKDPRLCLTLPCWTPFLEVPVALLAYRDPLEIASSLQSRGLFPEHSLALWDYHGVGALNASAQMPRVFVRYARMLDDPVRGVAELYSELERHGVRGLRMPSDREITAFVDPGLNRAKAHPVAAELQLDASQQTLDMMLRGQRPQEGTLEVSAKSVEAMTRAKARHRPVK